MLILEALAIIIVVAVLFEAVRYSCSALWAERRRLRTTHAELRERRDRTRDGARRLDAEVDEVVRTYRMRRVEALHSGLSSEALAEVYGIGEVLVRELKRAGFRTLSDISPAILDGQVKGIGPEKGRAILSFVTRHEVETRAQVDSEVKAGASLPESLGSRQQAAHGAAEEAERAYQPMRDLYSMTRFRHAILRSARAVRARAQEIAQKALHQLAPATDPAGLPVPTAPTVPTARVDDAQDIIELAVAVARSDGDVSDAEAAVVERRLAELLDLPDARRPELRGRLQQLRRAAVDPAAPAERLSARCDALRRRLTAEMLFEVAIADGTLRPEEDAILARIFDLLDVPEELYGRLKRTWREAHDAPSAAPAAAAPMTPEQQRLEWLASLELPRDVALAREVLDRAHNRVLQTYREDRFVGMNPEFVRLAETHRQRADEAYTGLCGLIPAAPAAPPAPEPPAGSDGDGLRHNPSLDDIFG